MPDITNLSFVLILIFLTVVQSFIPHPSIRLGAQAGESKF